MYANSMCEEDSINNNTRRFQNEELFLLFADARSAWIPGQKSPGYRERFNVANGNKMPLLVNEKNFGFTFFEE